MREVRICVTILTINHEKEGITLSVSLAGYTRISVDDELDKDNTSIENQKAIIEDYVKTHFPESALTFYVDRDRSGYTFEQREQYQAMRKKLFNTEHQILIIKDFSRFSRRNGRGLVELEDLRDNGVRIISIGDGIDYPTNDDWLAIQIHFFVNEMPVTDTSKKVKNVIKRRQSDGNWICAVPYGYVLTNTKTMAFEVDEEAASIVRIIYDLYNNGWGYKRISNHLTELCVPTPRMLEKHRKEARGEECKIKAKQEWSIITIQGILENDFYIGTLRQAKYTRKKINGADVKRDEQDHIVFENNHTPIIDYRTFALAQEQRKKRTVSNYRGIKVFENSYSGFLFCGDCGSPMFAMSRRDLKPAYTCGSYHRRGLKGCTSHHTRVDILDKLLKSYVQRIRDNSHDMIEQLERSIKSEDDEIQSNDNLYERLTELLNEAHEELRATKRQKIREIMKRPEQEAFIEETYFEIEKEIEQKILGLQNQINLSADKRNTIIQVNRVAKTAIQVFDDILCKETLDKVDIDLIIDKITVFEDHIEIKLKSDIDTLLSGGAPEENAVNFQHDTKNILNTQVIQSSEKRKDKVFSVNVISRGDPLEIYTDKDGEVIFKKYSPMGELSEFATSICDTLFKTTGQIAAVTDRDMVIAVAGISKRELMDKRCSVELERIMEERQMYLMKQGDHPIRISDGADKYAVAVAAPIISEGDLMGCVTFLQTDGGPALGDTEYKLAQTVAGFLGKQMEA